jgi:hypothetical protein
MIPRFKETCQAITNHFYHKDRSVRAAIILILPELAAFCTVSFARSYLHDSVEMLLRCARSTDLRPQALLSIGKLCRALGEYLIDHQDRVQEIVGELKSYIQDY